MRVEIWSDVICPWCYIGKRRFEQALAGYEGRDGIEIVFRPYQLDPTASPGKSMPVREAYARKFGGYDEADRIMNHVSGVAAGVGLEFHLDRSQRANTLLAHRLLWAAEHHGGAAQQIDLKERLLQAYFVDGENVGDPDTLARIAADTGMTEDVIAGVLEGDAGLDDVRSQLEEATDLGITAVPTFVFEGRWTVPGAQDAETFLAVFRKVEELMAAEIERERLTPAGEACEDDACGI
jgi:predicted DsbA family dithiol-disulfide isomerase